MKYAVAGGRRPVPSFFRDASALKSLQRSVREILETAGAGKSLRVWVPRCSTGEDAYSVAICLLEAFGSRWREVPLCVFATDADADSLALARAGRYSPDAARGMPRGMLERYFIRESNRIRVRPFVRDACRFSIHNPAQRPPFSQLDLIACRETLATIPAHARLGALRFFHSALPPGGILLDPTGTAASAPDLFARVGRGRCYAARSAAAVARGREVRHSALADARLQESEERFRILFSRAEDAILVRDAETDLILQANAAALRLYGWSLPELLAMRGKDLLAAPEDVRRPKNERRSEERLRLPHGRRKDGTFFPADDSTSFLMLQGRPCSLWMVRDATPRLRLNTGRRSEKEQDAFVGEVVHELRSPISVIRGSVETLRQGVRGTRARKTFLAFIENHAVRMGRLVDRLLDLNAADSAKRSVAPIAVPLAEAVWEITAAFVPVAKRRGIVIKIDIPANLAVLADPADLPHVFGNLLDNAIKFTPRGGKVHIHGRAEGGEGILSVRDTGEGIAPEDLSRIFERFFRGARARRTKGTGLGLAIVHGIVKANHGWVRAENDPAGGAVFHVALPLNKGKVLAS